MDFGTMITRYIESGPQQKMTPAPELPKEVYFVARIPPEDEKIPYYGRKLNRLYKNLSAAKTFYKSESQSGNSKYKMYKATVIWEEVICDDK